VSIVRINTVNATLSWVVQVAFPKKISITALFAYPTLILCLVAWPMFKDHRARTLQFLVKNVRKAGYWSQPLKPLIASKKSIIRAPKSGSPLSKAATPKLTLNASKSMMSNLATALNWTNSSTVNVTQAIISINAANVKNVALLTATLAIMISAPNVKKGISSTLMKMVWLAPRAQQLIAKNALRKVPRSATNVFPDFIKRN